VTEAAAPIYRRTRRNAFNRASRLGFALGSATEDIKIGNGWYWHAFHLAHATIIGSLSAPVTAPYANSSVQIVLFDAEGHRVLETKTGSAD
jgi:hypothetical protein